MGGRLNARRNTVGQTGAGKSGARSVRLRLNLPGMFVAALFVLLASCGQASPPGAVILSQENLMSISGSADRLSASPASVSIARLASNDKAVVVETRTEAVSVHRTENLVQPKAIGFAPAPATQPQAAAMTPAETAYETVVPADLNRFAPIGSNQIPAEEGQIAAAHMPSPPSVESPDLPVERLKPGVLIDAITAVSPASAPTPQPTASPLAADKTGERPLGIYGAITVDFGSRNTADGIDTYTVDLDSGRQLKVKGEIKRLGRETSSILGRETMPLRYQYALDLSSLGKKQLGAWSGTMPMTRAGVYDLAGLMVTEPASTSPQRFSGRIKGKDEENSGVISATYTRIFGKKKIAVKIQRADPIRFNGVRLPPIPGIDQSAATVTGNLDYDYDTGNWFTAGLLFQLAGGERDKVTGSIKWVPDLKREQNGKGQYEFNLRFNEDRYTKVPDEEEFFQSVPDEEAFFAVDDRVPAVRGVIRYQDRFGDKGEDGEPVVLSTKAVYELEGSGLNDRQLSQFLKVWLLIVGPVNDE